MPSFLGDYMGLKQRFFHFGWTLWFVGLSNQFIGLLKKNDIKN